MPRGGSTWITELQQTQPGYRLESEPFNLRSPFVQNQLGVTEWRDLYQKETESLIERYVAAKLRGRYRNSSYPIISPYPRVVTSGIIFKIIYGCEERAAWLTEHFGGKILLFSAIRCLGVDKVENIISLCRGMDVNSLIDIGAGDGSVFNGA